MSHRTRRREDPSELTPREASRRYLRRREADSTEKTVSGMEYRMKIFVEWCESVGIAEVGELRPYDIDEFNEVRSATVEPVTLEGEMHTLKSLCEFLEDLGAVEDGLSDSVRIPKLDAEDRSNDEKLDTEDAKALLEYFRNDESDYGTRRHATLELAWITGARQGGLRALDLRDVDLGENPYVEFRHRPETGTPLKNKNGGERPVALPRETADAVEAYIQEHRYDVHDDHGRQPLLTSMRGRPNTNTIRCWTYLATHPCLHSPCPHGKEREKCDWTEYHHASKCPSTRSPHRIRTGTITWLLNLGWPPEDVAERVNASVQTIEDHYDKASTDERRERLRDRMEERRRTLVEQLPVNDDDDE